MSPYSTLLGLNIAILCLYCINLAIWIAFMVAVSPYVNPVALLSITDAISYTFPTEIVIPPWAFSLWAVNYLWQLVWIIYSFILAKRFRQHGPPLLLTPSFLAVFLLVLVFQISLNIGALFVIELAFVFLVLVSVCLYVALGLVNNSLYKNRLQLANQKRRYDEVLVIALVQNGVALYATWTGYLAIVNLSILIDVRSTPPITPSIPGTVAVVLIAVAAFLFTVLDLTVCEKYSRYTFTPYFVRLWLLVAIVSSLTGVSDGNVVAVIVLLGVVIVSFIDKIVITCVRGDSDQLYTESLEDKEEPPIRTDTFLTLFPWDPQHI